MTVRRYYSGIFKTKDRVATAFSSAPTCKIEFTSTPNTTYDATVVSMNSGKSYYGYYDRDTADEEVAYMHWTANADADASDVTTMDVHWYDLKEVIDPLAVVDTNVDSILVDTATTIPADIAALPTAAEVWENSTRTLTQSATSIESSVSGSTITQTKGDTWSFDIEDLTLDSNLIQLAIKRSKSDTDAESLVFIDTDTGLLYLNGAAATAGDGSLSYAGTTLTVTLKATATDDLPYGTSFYYGIQSITAADAVTEAYGGTFKITDDVVDAVT